MVRSRNPSVLILIAFTTAWPACAWFRPSETERAAPPPAEVQGSAPPPVRVVCDPEVELRAARLELQLLEKEAQIHELQARLDEARREVVRSMAKLQTVASRAEAASAIAEAEVAFQSLRETVGSAGAPEVGQVRQLLDLSSREFDEGNYGGALYLANQAKRLVRAGGGRLAAGRREALRPDEVLFSTPLRLQALATGNVRQGPGMQHSVLYTVERGAPLVGHSYEGEWVRVSDESGRGGWIFLTLVGRRSPGASR